MRKSRFFLVLAVIMILSVSCAFHSSGQRFGVYSEAENLYQKGKYDAAAEKYERYLSENPQGSLAAIASYYLAKCYTATGKPDAAKAGFQKVIADYPGTSWAEFSKRQLEDLGVKQGS